jgi:hypothetical protein
MMPAKNYPPAQIASQIKQCEAAGRPDLGQAIMQGWNNCFDKYTAKVGTSWGAATVIGGRSVKKNVFGGMEFNEWLGSQRSQAQAPKAKRAKKAA